MIYAVDALGARVQATRGGFATCPQCDAPMLAKCGPIVVNHWSHHARPDCDSWAEPESEWHLGWKQRFADAGAQIEVVMRRDELWHRADVLTRTGWVVEVQRSAIALDDARARESFYGQRQVWMWDMTDAERWDRVHFGRIGFWWRNGSKTQSQLTRPLWWHVPDGRVLRVQLGLLQTSHGERVLGKLLRAWSVEQFVNIAMTGSTGDPATPEKELPL